MTIAPTIATSRRTSSSLWSSSGPSAELLLELDARSTVDLCWLLPSLVVAPASARDVERLAHAMETGYPPGFGRGDTTAVTRSDTGEISEQRSRLAGKISKITPPSATAGGHLTRGTA